MSEKTVFISYSHDSDEHAERVRGLCASLSRDGCDCRLDVYKDTDEDWPIWMTRQLLETGFVLCVVTETYARRFQDRELPDQGKGVGWEAGLIRRLLYQKKLHNNRIFPVFFVPSDERRIPLELVGYDFFFLAGAGYEALLRKVLNQPNFTPPDAGRPPNLGTRTTPPLFPRPGETPSPDPRIDISRILKYAPADLIGREAETKLLNDTWTKIVAGEPGTAHILTFVALGGEGKTSLVASWLAELAGRGWPGCDAVFAWSFYSQGTREQQAASSDLFLAAALSFFGDDVDKAFAGSNAGAHEKGQRLARLVGGGRNLLILDGLEPLQYAPTSPMPSELKDQGIAALLKGLAATSRGLCVVTTRYSLPDLKAFRRTSAPERKLERLSREAGVRLLRDLGVRGAAVEFETLVEEVKGHALTLTLLGSYLRDAHGGDIRRRDRVRLEKADAEEQGGHAFHVMVAYERALEEEGNGGRRALAVLRLLGLFDRPMTADCLGALLQAPIIEGLTEPLVGIPEDELNITLTRLASARLITLQTESFSIHHLKFNIQHCLDAHPLLREYFAQQLREHHPDAWREAHRRLYEHLHATTPEKERPSLEELQPLYQAVAHGCLAGIQQDAYDKVYNDRIARKEVFYSTKKLGAFGADLGAVACFFEQPWSRITTAITEADQALLLNQAAYRLRALGRLTEALEPMRAGLEMRINQQVWKSASISAGNLSGLKLMLGDVTGAMGDAEHSLTYADLSGGAFLRIARHTTLADALHQAGRQTESETSFIEAEKMQAEREPLSPVLYSVQGFKYCDLLLAPSELTAWRFMQDSSSQIPNSQLINACREVGKRAMQTLKIAEQSNLTILTVALDHLTMGRAALYVAILEQNDFRLSPFDLSHIDTAVAGLRRAGTTHHIPRSLLTRAWFRFLTGPKTGPDSAQADLDEAWEIAERGPMRLHMADIHLHRARLFFRETDYPWESPRVDLAAARKLIEQCGYWRRKEELEEAEAVMKG